MHTGKSYHFSEFLTWTKGNIFILLLLGTVPVVLYQVAGIKWLAMPWTVVALLGTATAFIVGFKNTQTYNRNWEAQQVWMSVFTSSRNWGIMCRDFLDDSDKSRELIYRHFAWLTAMRYQLRESRIWETMDKKYNRRYKQFYKIPEKETSLEGELAKYISAAELQYILSTKNPATHILALQSKTVKALLCEQKIPTPYFIELEKGLRDFYDQQGKSERIKNFPYPRQYAVINSLFIKLFCLLLPFGMLHEFEKLNDSVDGIMKGNMVWLVIPFSIVISWMYTSLEQVGESSENPFEGSANDVPLFSIGRNIEIDLREMLGETDLPPVIEPINDIIL